MKKWILIISCLISSFIICFMMINDSTTIMGIKIIDQNNFMTNLCDGRTKSKIDIIIKYENEIIPYIEEHDIYLLSQSIDTNYYQGRISLIQDYQTFF